MNIYLSRDMDGMDERLSDVSCIRNFILSAIFVCGYYAKVEKL